MEQRSFFVKLLVYEIGDFDGGFEKLGLVGNVYRTMKRTFRFFHVKPFDFCFWRESFYERHISFNANLGCVETLHYLSDYSFASEEFIEEEQLDEYLQTEEGNVAFGILIFLQDKEKEGIKNQDVIERMEPVLRDAGIGNSWARVVFVKNKELLDEINKENYIDMLYRYGEKKIYTYNYSGRVNDELKQ